MEDSVDNSIENDAFIAPKAPKSFISVYIPSYFYMYTSMYTDPISSHRIH